MGEDMDRRMVEDPSALGHWQILKLAVFTDGPFNDTTFSLLPFPTLNISQPQSRPNVQTTAPDAGPAAPALGSGRRSPLADVRRRGTVARLAPFAPPVSLIRSVAVSTVAETAAW